MAAAKKKPSTTKPRARNTAPPKNKAKPAAPPPPQTLRHTGVGLLVFVVFMFAISLVPGPAGAWRSMQNAVWGLGGMALPLWLLWLGYCGWLLLRNTWPPAKTLRSVISLAAMILCFGGGIYLLQTPQSTLASTTWGSSVSACFAAANPRVQSGVPAAGLGFLLAKPFGSIPTAVLLVLLFLLAMPLAFPSIYSGFFTYIDQIGAPALPPAEPATAAAKPPKRSPSNERSNRVYSLEADELALDALAPPLPQQRSAQAQTLGTVLAEFHAPPASPPPDHEHANIAMAQRLDAEPAKRERARKAGSGAHPQGTAQAPMPDPDQNGYAKPPLSCLAVPKPERASKLQPGAEEEAVARNLVYTLKSFGVDAQNVGYNRGPAVTRYELRPAEGVKISKITALADDIALRLEATKVRIEAPIPGKAAVGVEIPNQNRSMVALREIIDSDVYRGGAAKSGLNAALGKNIVGDLVCADIAKLPHLLIAGTTGSGKSVCMNTLIVSLLYNAAPQDIKFIMVDPKQVEFNIYSGIPHLLVPVVSDPLKAAGALGWAVGEMERRYSRISEQNVRDLDSYNQIAQRNEGMEHMPKIVIFIDELSDLMMVAPGDVEDSIQRIAQKGRAAGMHLVVATQRPSVDVVTGVIKSNLPGRIALSVASQIDSRTIINTSGAEQLLGNGDMLFSQNGGNNAVRVQGCYVSDKEVQGVVEFVRAQAGTEGYDEEVQKEIERNAAVAGRGKKANKSLFESDDSDGETDPMLDAAIEVVVNAQLASTTMLQKKLKLGYARASRLIDELEGKGIIGPAEGSKPRKVRMSPAQWQQYNALEPEQRSAYQPEEV